MRFGQEKRRLLGTLAFLAPLPLPFNQVLEWPVLFVYALLVLYVLQRTDRGLETHLPVWSLNLLGLIYLPILIFDLRLAMMRGRIVMALLHLILFLVVVKLYSMRREKDKWHLTIAIFFLFVGAMATSSHVSVVLYLIVFLGFGLWLLGRFAHLHVLAAVRQPLPASGFSLRAPLVAGTLIILMAAIPLFAVMPRFRQPFVFGQGAGGGSGLIRSTGFSESVDLNLTSSIRGNRDVAFRIKYDASPDTGAGLRFKAIAYDLYRDRQWHRNRQETRFLTPGPDGRFQLAEGEVSSTATLYLEALNSNSLMLPMEAVGVRLQGPTILSLSVDSGGGIRLPWVPPNPIRYELELSEEPLIAAALRGARGQPLALDASGVSDRMRELARTVTASAASDEERIRAVEQHLLTSYSYTLDFVGRDGEQPLDDFLFVYQSGHCEYFASAMVLMLRSLGIPARLVTGFLGAEYNPLENYFIVRQQNAHAWVEAHSPAGGWRVYDPTPPEGRPAIAEQSLGLLVGQFYDYLTFRWDRYVLTFGADDQVGFFERVKETLRSWRERWRRWFGEADEPPAPLAVTDGAPTEIAQPARWQPWRPWLVALLAAFVGCTGWLAWRYHHPQRAEIAYRRLRALLQRSGVEVEDSVAPLQLAQSTGERFPASAPAVRELVDLYLEESFAERPLPAKKRDVLSAALREVRRAIRA